MGNPSEHSPMLSSITIRSAVQTDASSIAMLLAQLGYPATPAEAAAQLAHLQEFPYATAFVAELQGQVIGLVTGHVFPSIHDAAFVAWLTTLVIDEQHLQKGVGRQLSAAIESWANDHGAARVSVTSGKHRDGAHAFYERIGYQRTGLRLTKVLASI
jgi:GNAT superfamily N-acetyltransferase